VIKSRWAEHEARSRKSGDVCGVLVGKPERKRPTGRHIRKLEDNIQMDLQEVGCGVMDWIDMAQDKDR
jgi:hypothetical protein